MKENILNEITDALDHARRIPIAITNSIKRDTKNYKLLTQDETKHHQMVFTKRALLENQTDSPSVITLPFGYELAD